MDWLTATTESVMADYDGASGSQWMQLRCEADLAGRLDLVQLCIDQAVLAYEDEESES